MGSFNSREYSLKCF